VIGNCCAWVKFSSSDPIRCSKILIIRLIFFIFWTSGGIGRDLFLWQHGYPLWRLECGPALQRGFLRLAWNYDRLLIEAGRHRLRGN